MSIAALSLLPRLQTVWASGGPITNLGLIMICSAQTITKLDLSKYTFSIALTNPLPLPPPNFSCPRAPHHPPTHKGPPLPPPCALGPPWHAWPAYNMLLYLMICLPSLALLIMVTITPGCFLRVTILCLSTACIAIVQQPGHCFCCCCCCCCCTLTCGICFQIHIWLDVLPVILIFRSRQIAWHSCARLLQTLH